MTLQACVFCQPDKRYVIADSVYSVAVCFPDAVIKRGHFVVAVKDHVTSFTDLSPEQASDLMSFAARLAKKAEALVRAEKYYLVAIADQVRHFHLHLLPKMPGDAPIGKHIMSDSGWKAEVGECVSPDAIQDFICMLK
ncbi:MAG: HIT family protein [Candidatus Auribacter fodinae]|jgi:diadenosine tetraphosphate (Ap4A) HIT family hydrolase|uniref:HIT family protein n=1 Tax=Candidatus Auribacter fodinae TaxID=2093366 RepID=A0A3A4QPY7_9BACT|nr:MAG: HIT family protein [Candidatus Auribacter fodinae]